MHIDTASLKRDYLPSDVLENLVGLTRVGGSAGWNRYRYGNGRPGLVCNDSTGTIFEHHNMPIEPGGGSKTDVIGFVQAHFGTTFIGAVDMITGQSPSDSKGREFAEPKLPEKPPFSIKQLRQWNISLLTMGEQFLTDRMISKDYAKQCMLGYRYKSEYGSITLKNGKKFRHMSGWRVVFPTLRTVPKYDLIRVNERLDTLAAKKTLHLMPEPIIASLAHIGGEDDVIKKIWGAKYLSLGSPVEPFQGWLIKKWNGANYYYPRIPLLYVTEGEIDSINLYEASAPSIPAKKAVVNGADRVVIVQDNGGDGPKIAEKTFASYKSIGQEVEIMSPYEGMKDINDMARAGILNDWLIEHNLPAKRKTS
jgi:hypothetical protein